MKVALFDLDGVIIDTEGQYGTFWHNIGQEFLSDQPNFSQAIKGMSLVQIYDAHFAGNEGLQTEITRRLNAFEKEMHYPYFPGVVDFLQALRAQNGVAAVVTSSNEAKMRRVYAEHPELPTLFSKIFTAEHVTRSKPAPDCYLNAAAVLGKSPSDCVVFEDSWNGLKAGRASGAKVVALATSLSRDFLESADCATLYDVLIDDFSEKTPEILLAN